MGLLHNCHATSSECLPKLNSTLVLVRRIATMGVTSRARGCFRPLAYAYLFGGLSGEAGEAGSGSLKSRGRIGGSPRKDTSFLNL